jgi:adenylate kinase
MPTYFVMLGPPGAGKGTQAQIGAEKLGLPHVSSGDIFRENMKNQTELGKLAKDYIDKGDLVPDDVTISMIRERLSRPDCAPGALLDGFPRTPAQADALAKLLIDFGGRVNAVPFIKVPDEVLVERLAGRWTCRSCGAVYHQKFNPPQQAGVCDECGSHDLYQRDDDKEETVKNRIKVYYRQTMPLIEYYQAAGALIEIDGTQSIERVTVDLLAALAGIN